VCYTVTVGSSARRKTACRGFKSHERILNGDETEVTSDGNEAEKPQDAPGQ